MSANSATKYTVFQLLRGPASNALEAGPHSIRGRNKYSKTKILVFLAGFALMSPLGVFIADKVVFFTDYSTEVTALIIGVFLHISTIILFESSENHKFNLQKFIVIIIGFAIALLSL